MHDSNTPLLGATAILSRYIQAPDTVLPEGREPEPIALAVAAGAGLAGAAIFAAVASAGTADSGGGGLALVPPLAGLLAFPPLYLLTACRGRSPGLLRLSGIAVAGPTVAGAWLGAASPLLLLYAMTGEIDASFRVLVVLMGGMAVFAGAIAAVRNSRAAGASAPGVFTVLAHYAFTLWTALVLALHLA